MKLVLLYAIISLIEIIAIIIVNKRLKKKNIKKISRILSTLLFLIVFLFTLRKIIIPGAKDIPTTGSYKYAIEDYWLVENKADPYFPDRESRELQIRKWYPIDCNEMNPVIIASHGSCGTIDNNVSLYKELASHGYIVLAVTHPGQASSITYSNGKTAGPSSIFISEMTSMKPQENLQQTYETYKAWMEIRVYDLNTVMNDYSTSLPSTKYIMLGHSLGGSACYAMARIRNDVIGCIALESPFMYDIVGAQNDEYIYNQQDYTVPLLNIYSDSSYPHLSDWKQYRNNILFLNNNNSLYSNIYYEGTSHMGLCDLSLASPLLSSLIDAKIPSRDANEVLKQLNTDCLDWIEKIQ